jgi:2-polyprenyl-3-methyl-5-hydroxy-6-metoxy-1,4-benzoquinol methylase
MTDNKIRFNIKAHNKVAKKYEGHHTQIFNAIEQQRIKEHLAYASSLILSSSNNKKAFDFGCGSGNITRHLLELGFSVTAADVAQAFLQMVEKRFNRNDVLQTTKINGTDLSNISDNSYDLTVSYSVLHHIPEYLPIVQELIRVTKPGGIILIDREAAACYWVKSAVFQEFMDSIVKQPPVLSIVRFFKPGTYSNRWQRIINPRFQPEGDIHVWQDDHIEWDKIKEMFLLHNCKILMENEYLSYDGKYQIDIYNKYKDLCADDMVMVARKNTSR